MAWRNFGCLKKITLMAKDFPALIEDIYRLAKLKKVPRSPRDAVLEVDGVTFTLVDITHLDEDTLAYFCDFGPPPRKENRMEMLQRLLEANLHMFGARKPSFSIDYETGHVLLMGTLSIGKAKPESLLGAFSKYALQAKQWKNGDFPDIPDIPKKAKPDSPRRFPAALARLYTQHQAS